MKCSALYIAVDRWMDRGWRVDMLLQWVGEWVDEWAVECVGMGDWMGGNG